jgi:hypothetical protein
MEELRREQLCFCARDLEGFILTGKDISEQTNAELRQLPISTSLACIQTPRAG